MKHLRALMAALLLFTFVGAACGGDDDDSTASGSTTTVKDDGGDADAPPEYTITASEGDGTYKFDVPDDIKGGVVTLKLDNSAGKEVHDLQLVKLDGHPMDEVTKQISDDSSPVPAWIKDASGIGSVPPGATLSATVKLEPNTEYGFFCTENNEEKKLSHATHGMNGTFTTGDDSGATMPEGTATIDTAEYKFALDGLKAGSNTVAFKNGGSMLHHVIIVPFADGKTLDDLKTALSSEDQSAPPPVDFEKGSFSAVAGPGDEIVYDIDLQAGHYAILCFMPDLGTAGPPHAMKGMIDEFTIS
jgi:hypothetical protein